MLSLHELSKRFQAQAGVVAALEAVSLEIATGELFVLVGDSGSGKTTLLRSRSFWSAGGRNQAAAVTLVMTVVLIPLLLIFWWFGRWSQVQIT